MLQLAFILDVLISHTSNVRRQLLALARIWGC